MAVVNIKENKISTKKDREVYVIERDKYIRCDIEYPDFSGSTKPFDKPKKVKSVAHKAISKARKCYHIMEKEKKYNKVSYNKYTGELSIKIEMDYWKRVARTHCVNTEDYTLMCILEWIDSFISRKLSKCNIKSVYYQFIINIERL